MEIRRTQDYPGALCEIRAGDEGDSPKLAGLGAPYGVWSEDLGGGFGKFRERFEVGAFRSSVAADDIRALYNHESGQVLGRVSAGTLRLNETERGIEYEIDLPDTSFARDLAVSVEAEGCDGQLVRVHGPGSGYGPALGRNGTARSGGRSHGPRCSSSGRSPFPPIRRPRSRIGRCSCSWRRLVGRSDLMECRRIWRSDCSSSMRKMRRWPSTTASGQTDRTSYIRCGG